MTYIQKRKANRCYGQSLNLVEHAMKKLEVEPAADTAGTGVIEIKERPKRNYKKGASNAFALNKVLEEIGINTGLKVKQKKLSPIDTTVLLKAQSDI